MVRIVSVALLLVAMLAGSASAECAWVLWASSTSVAPSGRSLSEWQPLAGYDSRKDCEQPMLEMSKKHASPKVSDGGFKMSTSFACLPDTVDPHGPKQ